MRVLVLGGYGAVGGHLVTHLRRRGDTVVVAGRDPDRAGTVIDLQDPALAAYRAALPGIDVTVNASGAENPRLAALAGYHGSAFIEISASTAYLRDLAQLKPQSPVVVEVGLAPGLTNLLAAAVYRTSPGPIDLAVFLGAGEQHGPAAIEWSYQLLGKRFRDGDENVRNYTQPETFLLPGHRKPRRLYRLDFADQHTLQRDFDVAVRTFFGLDSRLATTALAALTWLPGASKAPRGFHLPGTDQWIVLARGHDRTTRWARGTSQSRATAIIAATAASHALHVPSGTHSLHHILALTDLPLDEIELDTRQHRCDP
ncbi:hypothetical protein ACFO5K_09000 [Nocardia halotolerans]|uniref:Saccharopine dehydrogenase n=1 Tax=Nocardia halotolerans TaxID=1755878 RepID=A0ABV8VFW0_9NOCA